MRILVSALAGLLAVSLPAHADEAAETPSFLNGPIVAQANEDDRISAHADEAADGVTFINGPLLSQAEEEKPEEISAECQAFRADINANVSDLVRAGCEPTLAQMSKLMDNPLGNVAMLFTQGDWTRLENRKFGKSKDQYLYTGIAQFPKKLSDDWNLINRVVWTVPSVPVNQDRIDEFSSQQGAIVAGSGQPPPGVAPLDVIGGRTTDFGDMYYVGLFSPEAGIPVGEPGESVVWGLGFDLAFPTATEDVLGSGRWSAGPSALGVFLGKKWKFGALFQHYWDYAGDSNRDDVNMTNLQYFIFYSLDKTTSIGASPNIIANWEEDSDNAFSVPIGIGASKTLQFGKLPVRIGAEFHYYAIRPDSVPGAEWNTRFYIIPAIPSAFIDILN